MIKARGEAEEEKHKSNLFIAWHTAAFSRIKKLPSLKEVLGYKKAVQGIDESAIMARLKKYNERLANGKS